LVTIKNQKCKGEKGWWHITELGIGVSTIACKEWLEYLCSGKTPEGKRKDSKKWKNGSVSYLHDMNEYHGPNSVHFMIKPKKEFIPDMEISGNLKTELITTGSFNNMWLLDENGYPHKFEMVEDILEVFCPKRLHYYELRKEYMLEDLKREYAKASNRYRFVKAVRDKKIKLGEIDEGEDLNKLFENKPWEFERVLNKKTKNKDYEYLLSMHMRSMTPRKLAELQKATNKFKKEIAELEKLSAKDLWLADLNEFEIEYRKFLIEQVFTDEK